jgi:GNAT superfamily N-acetyltransferase
LTPEIVVDRQVLRALCLQDPITAAYLLGDLESQPEHCRWYGAWGLGALRGVYLVYQGLSLPALISFGAADAVGEAMREFQAELPSRTMVHLMPEHLAVIDPHFRLESLRSMVRMGLRRERFEPAPEATWQVEELGHRDTGPIMELFQHYPDHFFEPTQLGTRHYYGIKIDGRLRSVAGVHVVSADVACLGNIVTHPDFRGRGLSTACTSFLCQCLLDEGVSLLALNVARHNRSAVRVYEKLGFLEHSTYLEALATLSLDGARG